MSLLFENETHKIIGACMQVHKKLGCGFLESIYQEALEIEFQKQQISSVRQQKLPVLFDGKPLNKYFMADFVCYNSIIIEIKAAVFLYPDNSKQVINYLKATNFQVGLLINFGHPSLNWKRFIHTPSV